MKKLIKLGTLALLLLPCAVLASESKVNLKLATITPPKSVWAPMIQSYIDRVKELSNGSITITPYWGGQLGTQQDTMNQVVRGRVDMWAGPIPGLASLADELTLLSLPYLFKDYEQTSCVMPKLVAPTNALLEDKAVFLNFTPVGWMDVQAVEPVKAPSDLEGVKLRSAEQNSSNRFWQAIGAAAVPIPPSQTNEALSTGLVSAAENVLPYHVIMGTDKLAPYYSPTHHNYNTGGLIIGKRAWARLDEQQRNVMKKALDAMDYGEMTDTLKAYNQDLLAKLRAGGGEIVDISDQDMAKWRAAGKSIHDGLMSSVRGDPKAYMQDIKDAIRQCGE